MPEYSSAPDAEKIAERLIADHHRHLIDTRVEFVFRDKASKKNGKVVLGTARKTTGLNAFLARRTADGEDTGGEEFFVIELAKDEWDEMPPSKRRAAVDHELCHCSIEYDEEKGIVTLGIRAHDVEEFAEVVERHGLWKDDLADFAKAVKEQLDLFETTAAADIEAHA